MVALGFAAVSLDDKHQRIVEELQQARSLPLTCLRELPCQLIQA
jgi:hypothetical protein